MIDKTAYKAGIKEGRLQVIRNIKKHYNDTYSSPPQNIGGCETGVCIPETTLCSYFKELAKARGKIPAHHH